MCVEQQQLAAVEGDELAGAPDTRPDAAARTPGPRGASRTPGSGCPLAVAVVAAASGGLGPTMAEPKLTLVASRTHIRRNNRPEARLVLTNI